MREEAVDDEGVEGYDEDGADGGDDEGPGDGDALVHGVGVLEGVVLQSEVLVEGLDGVEGEEGDGEDDDDGVVEDVSINIK